LIDMQDKALWYRGIIEVYYPDSGKEYMEHPTTLQVTLPSSDGHQLQVMATRLGVSPEDLVRVSIQMLIAQPQQDVAEAVAYVLKKNAELYRRLA
jgi:antitoxin FitA